MSFYKLITVKLSITYLYNFVCIFYNLGIDIYWIFFCYLSHNNKSYFYLFNILLYVLDDKNIV